MIIKSTYGETCQSNSQCNGTSNLVCNTSPTNNCNCPYKLGKNICDCPTSSYWDGTNCGNYLF
jgi:hypothetical protein